MASLSQFSRSLRRLAWRSQYQCDLKISASGSRNTPYIPLVPRLPNSITLTCSPLPSEPVF